MRAVGALAASLFVFFAIVYALSRLLEMKELPGFIYDISNGIGNLFKGAYAR